jgi:hypothetical protein
MPKRGQKKKMEKAYKTFFMKNLILSGFPTNAEQKIKHQIGIPFWTWLVT